MTTTPPAADLIVGTWRLVSFTEEDLQTGAVTYPFGHKPNAVVIYTADGYVATIFTATDRKPPADATPTDAEAIRLFRSMIAFAGRYEIDGDTLIYHPEASWNEAWNGTTQTRLLEITPDRLHVRSVPVPSTLTGTNLVFSLTWARAG
ncbi:lipocalin-like domain-containing protein [Reyranella sp. CPCC 100927]|uniref:lipocalin-like domain-containing protein n=1 Tax=Reyranella sp. CPCC 100927 TaxID=2599616 RepID=UPI0011B66F65|nr:lipocalin-like domain-containing protein [Reyranella sp. CPCC 100927]TWT06132.1 lipocalin-like domain-containing protein [Reyranella sp. CPCC 100927]